MNDSEWGSRRTDRRGREQITDSDREVDERIGVGENRLQIASGEAEGVIAGEDSTATAETRDSQNETKQQGETGGEVRRGRQQREQAKTINGRD